MYTSVKCDPRYMFHIAVSLINFGKFTSNRVIRERNKQHLQHIERIQDTISTSTEVKLERLTF